jgi:hypothetical protein
MVGTLLKKMFEQMFEAMKSDAAKWQPQLLLNILNELEAEGFCDQNHFKFWAEQSSYSQTAEFGIRRSGEMYSKTLYIWENGKPLPTKENVKEIVLEHLKNLPPAFETWAGDVKRWALISPIKEIMVDNQLGCVWFKISQKSTSVSNRNGYAIHEDSQSPKAYSLSEAKEIYAELTKPKPIPKPVLKKNRNV